MENSRSVKHPLYGLLQRRNVSPSKYGFRMYMGNCRTEHHQSR